MICIVPCCKRSAQPGRGRCSHHRNIDALNNERSRRRALVVLGDQCAMCAEDDIWVLAIDHVHNGGCAHRKALGVSSGGPFYRWVINNPEEATSLLQTICSNCHMRKSRKLAMALWAAKGAFIERS